MISIVRQDINLFKESGLNIEFTAESFTDYYNRDNSEHLNNIFSKVDWYKYSPVEINPYTKAYPINVRYENLLIGTMPPISYLRHPMHHTVINKNTIGGIPEHYYYYGNEGQCWDYFIQKSSRLFDIDHFLRKSKLAVSDIIKVCQRQQNINYIHNNTRKGRGRKPNAYSPSDTDLYNILLNKNLIDHLVQPCNNVKNLYFTSGRIKNILIDKDNHINLSDTSFNAFTAFIESLFQLNIAIEFAIFSKSDENWYTLNKSTLSYIKELLGNKVLFKVRLNRINTFTIICLPSPSMALGVTKQYLFHQWLKYYSESCYHEFLNGARLEKIYLKYQTVPSIPDFIQPWESFKRDIYQKSLNDWESLEGIQNQQI